MTCALEIVEIVSIFVTVKRPSPKVSTTVFTFFRAIVVSGLVWNVLFGYVRDFLHREGDPADRPFFLRSQC